MSKYRVEILPSEYKAKLESVLWLVLALSCWAWQPYAIPFQFVFQVLFCLAVLVYGVYRFRAYHEPQRLMFVADNGEVTMTHFNDGLWGDEATYTVSPHSRCGFGVVFLCLQYRISGKSEWLWITKDQLAQRDYRRISRIILGQQRA